MKKVLSLVLSLALIIATMALPISASAANIDLLSLSSENIDISYSLSSEPVHPGDTLTVDVNAAVTGESAINVSSYQLDIDYDESQLTLTTATSDTIKDLTDSTSNKYIRLVNNDCTISLPADKSVVSLGSLVFTVNANATGTSTSSLLLTDSAFNSISEDGETVTSYKPSESNFQVAIEANSYEITIGGNALTDGKTYYYPSGTNLSVSGTHISEVVVKNGEIEVQPTESGTYNYSISDAGTYTVKVTVIGKEADTKSFILSKETMAVELNTDFTPNALGYIREDEFTVPVKITGLASTAKAAMVSFKLTYDDTKLALQAFDDSTNITVNGDTVIYGDKANSDGLGNDAIVANLVFKVLDTAAYGNTTVSISNPQLALVKASIDPSKDSISVNVGEEKVVIVPTGDFATYSSTQATWTKTAYDVTVTPVDDAVSVKYAVYENLTGVDVENQSGLTNIYTNGDNLADGKINISTEKNYVIVAKVGDDPATYRHIATLKPGAGTWIDLTPPTVVGTLTYSEVQDSARGFIPDLSKLTFNDNSGVTPTVTYKLGDSGEYVSSGTSLGAVNFNGNLYINVTDAAGNVYSMAAVALKLDKDDPTITDMKVGDVKGDGSKDITASVADVGSGVTDGTLSVTVYYSASTDGTALTEVSAIEALANGVAATVAEGKATYNTKVAGRYYMVVADAAGHKAAASADASFNKIDAASGIKVALYNGATPAAGFKKSDADELTTYNGSNGSFRYVAITDDEAPTGYKNTMTLSKDGETAAAYTAGDAITDIGTYVLTITTAHNTDTTDKASATYKFSIVEETNMPSPNNDKRFNIIDFAMVKLVANKNRPLPIAANEFTGGLFSGDVTGDLVITTADLDSIIASIRAGEYPGTYSFNVLNKQTAENQE